VEREDNDGPFNTWGPANGARRAYLTLSSVAAAPLQVRPYRARWRAGGAIPAARAPPAGWSGS